MRMCDVPGSTGNMDSLNGLVQTVHNNWKASVTSKTKENFEEYFLSVRNDLIRKEKDTINTVMGKETDKWTKESGWKGTLEENMKENFDKVKINIFCHHPNIFALEFDKLVHPDAYKTGYDNLLSQAYEKDEQFANQDYKETVVVSSSHYSEEEIIYEVGDEEEGFIDDYCE